MTRLRAGSASDVGQLRSNNQDSKLVADDIALFAVADGMGGHQGGEVASAIAIATLSDVISEPTAEALVEAVQEANRRIFAQADESPELRGMGTTLVAIALVDQGTDTEEITWVNVGDSRVYVLRDGQLHQLSQDHNLVEELRRSGQLTDDEAATHPQRNIITRALGIDAEVEVDWRTVEPFQGDRYLLCSDGLFNEIDTEAIIDVLTAVEDPDEAAAELVRRANAGGGRDNITCVVVDVIDDDGRAARAAAAGGLGSAALTADGSGDDDVAAATPPATVEMPAVATGEAHREGPDDGPTPPAGSPVPPGPPMDAAGGGEAPQGDEDIGAGVSSFPFDVDTGDDEELPFGRPTTDLYRDMDEVGGRHRLVTVLVVVGVLVLLVAAALAGIRYIDSDGYFIRADGDRVVIYQGQPGGGILFGPSEKDVGRTPVGELTPEDRAALARTPEFDSLADARTELNTWDARARQAAAAESEAEEPEVSTTTTSTTTAPTTTTTAGSGDGPGPSLGGAAAE